MNQNLFYEFLSEDGDAYVRRKISDAIREQRVSGVPAVREYTFNRFNVRLNFETNQATIQDDLMPHGEHTLTIEELEKALQ